jgi:YHS domain-containing protein
METLGVQAEICRGSEKQLKHTGRISMNQLRSFLFTVLLAVWISAGVAPFVLAQEPAGDAQAGQEIIQTTCPVMVGNKIDPNIYTDYMGRRVYFCCLKCKGTFEANPEKYLDHLPQFAAAQPGKTEPAGFNLAQLVEPFGLATLSLLIVTFCFGFFMKKNPKVLHPWHRRLGYVTIVVALCHATLVLLAHNL